MPTSACATHVLRPYTIVTSPVYPNGMADDFVSSATDGSTRRTYRHAKAELTGQRDAKLHERNMGRWGYRGRSLTSSARMMYWHLAERAVVCWDAERALVNVSDFIEGKGVVTPVVRPWCELLVRHGWRIEQTVEVPTRRMRNGANRDARVEHEVIIDARRG
jgi:hypothetical protein